MRSRVLSDETAVETNAESRPGVVNPGILGGACGAD
jgi:hypothetical protein